MANKYHKHAGVKGSHLASSVHKDTTALKAHLVLIGTSEPYKKFVDQRKLKKLASTKTVKTPLPAVIKGMNKRLTEAQNNLFELRKKKKAGKDVRDELRKTLKYLNDNRIKKKEKMKELKLL